MNSDNRRLLVRNVSHLAIGQVVSTTLGILLSAVIGRALEPAQLGLLYTVAAISTFAYVIVDWGQGTYLVREMARGRTDEPELIGSALLFRLIAIVFISVLGVVIALPLGYSGQFFVLTLLAMVSGLPATLYAPFACSFRSRDRMDIDVLSNILGKAIALIATAIAMSLGGGLIEVILMQALGGISTLLIGAIAAARADVKVKAPVTKTPPGAWSVWSANCDLLGRSGHAASHRDIDAFCVGGPRGRRVVRRGYQHYWHCDFSRNDLLAATFPQLSRASRSLPDLRRTIDATSRVMFIAAAFTSSALYLFAEHIVAIIYGHGRFEETASILKVSAAFVPLLFLVLVLASAMNAIGKNKEMAAISVVRIVFCVVFNWLLIGYWQRQYGNGAIVLTIIAGLAEVPATVACLKLLPKGAVGSAVTLNMVRAYVASLCTVIPLAMLQPLGLLYLSPLFILLFAITSMGTRLVLPADLRLAMEMVRSKVLMSSPARSD